jgi:leader peptidase (prepilin peptidase)/N-methyltransferase
MIRVLGTVFAALLGLAFGSFLNVCLSRWPEGESVVKPRSHCRTCAHTLAWWENVPLVSWLALRGRCRGCGSWIGWRYPVVEAAVGGLWAVVGWRLMGHLIHSRFGFTSHYAGLFSNFEVAIGTGIFYFLLVGLAILDAEHFWLPDVITLPGIVLGALWSLLLIGQSAWYLTVGPPLWQTIWQRLIGIVIAPGLILLIRWVYWLVRKQEGIGLGDAKLMALLAAWLGLPGALLAFGLGVVMGAVAGLALLAVPSERRGSDSWAFSKLPLGTFLCIGGVVSSLWGERLIVAYLRWAGL